MFLFQATISLDDKGACSCGAVEIHDADCALIKAAPMDGKTLAAHLREMADTVEPWTVLSGTHVRDVEDGRERQIGRWGFEYRPQFGNQSRREV